MNLSGGAITLFWWLLSISPGLPILVFYSFLIYIGVWNEERQTNVLAYAITGLVALMILFLLLVLCVFSLGVGVLVVNSTGLLQ